jgi:hypothetical protein
MHLLRSQLCQWLPQQLERNKRHLPSLPKTLEIHAMRMNQMLLMLLFLEQPLAQYRFLLQLWSKLRGIPLNYMTETSMHLWLSQSLQLQLQAPSWTCLCKSKLQYPQGRSMYP